MYSNFRDVPTPTIAMQNCTTSQESDWNYIYNLMARAKYITYLNIMT